MRRILLVCAVVLMPLLGTPNQAKAADPTLTLGLTFATTLVGTGAGAVLAPYIVPAIAPTVAASYGVIAAGMGTVLTTVGGIIALEPRMTGAVIGMTGGLLAGIGLFHE